MDVNHQFMFSLRAWAHRCGVVRICTILLLVYFCNACSSFAKTRPTKLVHHPRSGSKYFSAVNCSGPVTVVIKSARPRGRRRWTTVRGENVYAVVKGQTLYLRQNNPEKKQPRSRRKASKNSTLLRPYIRGRVEISNGPLSALTLSGQCQVIGRNVQTRGMVIRARDHSYARLRGVVALRRVETSGDARVHVSWVNSHDLVVHTFGRSRVRLAGVSNILHARAFGDSVLDAGYLRVKQVYVQSDQDALAKVLPTVALRALASGRSNIYFYKTPGPNLKLARLSGNVLQMGFRY